MFPFDQNNQQMYEQYARTAEQGDYSQMDPTDAAGNLQQFAQNAPPEMQQRVYAQAFSQMPADQLQQFVQQLPPDVQGQLDPNDPQGMAQGFQQTVQQHPDLLDRVKEHPAASIAVAGLAAMAAKHLWEEHRQGGGI